MTILQGKGMPQLRLLLGIVALFLVWWTAERSASAFTPIDLGESIFDDSSLRPGYQATQSTDADKDFLKDNLEYKLAEYFKPLLVFAGNEPARLPAEPRTLFQVRPVGCVGAACPGKDIAKYAIIIKYAFLFQRDGGYLDNQALGSASITCKCDDHNGDNEFANIIIYSSDGRTWSYKGFDLGSFQDDVFKRPRPLYDVQDPSHVIIYMAWGKHHRYMTSLPSMRESVYSKYGCTDFMSVDRKSARIMPVLVSKPFSWRPRMRNNVGEPESHPAANFINNLNHMDFEGEAAWSPKPFLGGLGKDSRSTFCKAGKLWKGEESDASATSALIEMWMNHPFHIGHQPATVRRVNKAPMVVPAISLLLLTQPF